MHTPIRFQCLIDEYHIWTTQPHHIINSGTGCPVCAGIHLLNNNIIDNAIKNRPIKRIGHYINSHLPLLWQCLNNEQHLQWLAAWRDIRKGRGCPSCADQTLTNEIVDERIKEKPIKRIGNYETSEIKILWECQICLFQWLAVPHSILRGRGCPKCAGRLKLTNEIIDDGIKNRTIIRIGDCNGSNGKILWQCLNCNYRWNTTPSSIFNGKGCPKCQYGKNEKLISSILEEYNIDFIHRRRLRKINKKFPNYEVDFLINNFNLIIEYNGIQHYQPIRFAGMQEGDEFSKFEKQIIRDQNLEKFANENGYKIIWIDGRKYKNEKLKDYIINDIIPLLLKQGEK